MNLKAASITGAIGATLLLTNCQEKNTFAPPPPPNVTVAHPSQRDQIVYSTFPATLTGIAEVEIRARVRGNLEGIFFSEGKQIKQGDRLFSIEPEVYEAQKDSALADVDQAKAELRLATANLARLVKAGPRAVSEIDLERARADVDNAQAFVKQAEAKLKSAEIDLSYTSIHSPVTGRTSRTIVDVGNLVGNAEPTLLTTIVDESSVRAYYEIPERLMLEYYRVRAENKDIGKSLNKVNLELADGTVYEHLGTIDYIDNKVNPETRTAQVRAVFPNPKGKVSSGLFAEVGYPQTFKDAMLVPAISVLKDIGGSFVWIVDENNKVARRGVVTGASVYAPQSNPEAVPVRETIILKGLQATDRVIIRGVQRVREQATVTPQMENPATAKTAEPAEPEAQQ